jgi:hypothetical protein
MTGALSQLVAYGVQDLYLTGDAKKSFWKGNFKKYRNFALESIRQDIIGEPGSNNHITIKLGRFGDLVNGLMLEMIFQRGPSGPADIEPYYSCEQYIDHLELHIGGQKVYEFNHEWFRMYWELFLDYGREVAYRNLTRWGNEEQGYTKTFYLPIPIWFNALEPSQALPLIALI